MNTTTPTATRPSAAPLTAIQAKVLAYLVAFVRANHSMPTRAQIARDFGWLSPNAAQTHLKYLEKKGALVRNEMDEPMIAAQHLLAPAACTWRRTIGHPRFQYLTTCRKGWNFNAGDTPASKGLNFCPNCGGRVTVQDWHLQDETSDKEPPPAADTAPHDSADDLEPLHTASAP